jgi:GeoRSP system SPASM domain protein
MSLDLLDAPLRVTWDFPAREPALSAAELNRVAGRLTAAGVFAVTCVGQPLLSPALSEVLLQLRSGGCRTLIVHNGTLEETAVLQRQLPVDQLLLDVARFIDDREHIDTIGLGRALSAVRESGFEPGLQLVPSRRNLRHLPALLHCCRELRVAQLALPNTPVDDSFDALRSEALLRPADLNELRRALDGVPVAGVQLQIHDLFLWELFSAWNEGAGRGEYGGCQAGNSIGHIDGHGRLHPCSSWQEPLGSLLETELDELWQSPRRYAVRAAIAAIPNGCRGCLDYSQCFGGCRGLTRSADPDGDGRDLLCPGCRVNAVKP